MNFKNGKKFYISLLVLFLVGMLWSGYQPPAGHFTWGLEVFPAVIALFILMFTIKKFEFSKLVYILILLHAFILMHGGHTTYANEGIFNWIRDEFGLDRNYYDRLGHFAQGFTPAVIAFEYFTVRNIVLNKKWLIFIIIFFVLGFSAFYEFIEWWVSLLSGEAGNDFLGTQGDIWDTQWDMFMCFLGSLTALSIFRNSKFLNTNEEIKKH